VNSIVIPLQNTIKYNTIQYHTTTPIQYNKIQNTPYVKKPKQRDCFDSLSIVTYEGGDVSVNLPSSSSPPPPLYVVS
jgi:hypothetical protein